MGVKQSNIHACDHVSVHLTCYWNARLCSMPSRKVEGAGAKHAARCGKSEGRRA